MVVPGVELSAECNGCEVHVLGYFADNARLEPVLADLRAQRVVRARQMLARLRRLGIAVTWEQVLAETAGAAPGRPHLARTLVTLGYAGSVSEAFERYLSPGRPAYVPRQRLAPAAAVRLVRAGGGVAVLAHPGLGVPDRLLPELLAAGLQGVEVYYPGHSPADVCHYLRWAADRRLVVTGGSDFHGPGEREGAEVGSATVPVAVCRQLAELAGRQPPD
jgi:predicted metal-dependent phosphoesterase TrpH